jgi:hypothetical protein
VICLVSSREKGLKGPSNLFTFVPLQYIILACTLVSINNDNVTVTVDLL